jgi:hypothetical protein
MQTITTIGLDIAKSVFQVHGVDAAGQVVIWPTLEEQSLSFISVSVTVRPNCPIASSVRIDLAFPSRSTLIFRTVSASFSRAISN